jgi:hypothetical protein
MLDFLPNSPSGNSSFIPPAVESFTITCAFRMSAEKRNPKKIPAVSKRLCNFARINNFGNSIFVEGKINNITWLK